MPKERIIDTYPDAKAFNLKVGLRNQNTPAYVTTPITEAIGSETVIHGYNAYLNTPAWQLLQQLYPDDKQSMRNSSERIAYAIHYIVANMPEYKRPTVLVFIGDPSKNTAIEQASGVSLGFSYNPKPEVVKNIINSLFIRQDKV